MRGRVRDANHVFVRTHRTVSDIVAVKGEGHALRMFGPGEDSLIKAVHLEKMLTRYTMKFMRDSNQNQFDEKKRTPQLSKIFD